MHVAIFQDRVLVQPNGTGGLYLRCCAFAAACMFLLSHCIAAIPMVHAMVAHERNMDLIDLDRRTSAALQLFERQDPTAGEAELREMAQHYPSYAPPSFYLGLLSQKKQETETAVEFYVAALHAGTSLAACVGVEEHVAVLHCVKNARLLGTGKVRRYYATTSSSFLS